MTAVLAVLMLVAFALIDWQIRLAAARRKERLALEEREEVLRRHVRLDVSHEAKSLKRVEVPSPSARILAVDDEAVVLDSFRRILVLEGYSVDTVETGPEALGLLERHDYDFVFTDLKMPGMDGLEVVKAVKHLRPDIDVVVITGYGSIETAVATLQEGACDYVQKPFTAEELADFAKKRLIKRQARLETQHLPPVKVLPPGRRVTEREFWVPGGAFIATGHTWARIEQSGEVRVGLDDFAMKALGAEGILQPPAIGLEVRQGDVLFRMARGKETLAFLSPLSGRVAYLNVGLELEPALLYDYPYDRGFVCKLQPTFLPEELSALKIGASAVGWLQEEVLRLRRAQGTRDRLPWSELEEMWRDPDAGKIQKS